MNTSITYKKDGKDVDNLSFENKMSVTAAVIDPSVTKILNNAELKPGDFTFHLFDENGQLLDTKKNTDSGSVLFDSIVFDKEGEYHYAIKEVIPEDKGQITYDRRVIGVSVEVIKNKETGDLQADVIYEEDGSKDPLEGATYALYRVLGDEGRDILIDTQVSDASGYMTFENVEPGIYYFKEVSDPVGHTVDEYATKKFTVLPDGEISNQSVADQNVAIQAVTTQNIAIYSNPVSVRPVCIKYLRAGGCRGTGSQ